MNFQIAKNFMDKLTETIVPGNAIVVYHKNAKVFEYASGYADLESKEPMTADHLLNIYSCSKLTTVTAALQLLERGCFLLDDPLWEYIPEYRDMYVKAENGDPVKAKTDITIRHLFTMTAGLNYDIRKDSIQSLCGPTGGRMETLTVARAMAKDPLDFEPGSRWQYSLCHDVLAAVVEVISGQKFRDYVAEHIFEPIGIKDAYYHHTDELEARMASQYRCITDPADSFDLVKAQISGTRKHGTIVKEHKNNTHIFGSEYDSGGAGILVSVSEYAKLANMLANFGKAENGEQILSCGTVGLLRTNQLSAELLRDYNWKHLKGYGYGLGVRTCIDKSAASSIGSVGEFGWGGAAGAMLLADPDRELSFFYAHHMLNPQEEYYMPRIRNAVYACF